MQSGACNASGKSNSHIVASESYACRCINVDEHGVQVYVKLLLVIVAECKSVTQSAGGNWYTSL